jgi:hypothetical protein
LHPRIAESGKLEQMGENDVKFTRFARLYGDCIAHSVDGDYIPIALMEHERQVMLHGRDKDPTRIAIYRLEFNMTPASARPKLIGAKRTADGVIIVKGDKHTRTSFFIFNRASLDLFYTPLIQPNDLACFTSISRNPREEKADLGACRHLYAIQRLEQRDGRLVYKFDCHVAQSGQ